MNGKLNYRQNYRVQDAIRNLNIDSIAGWIVLKDHKIERIEW